MSSAIPYIPNSRERGFYTRIAKLTGYSRQQIGKILRGEVGYSTKSLTAIASACGVEVGWLADYIAQQSTRDE